MPLTGLGAPLVSFPFVDLDHVMLSQGLMRQFVMVLVARFRMSVADIVIAYALVSPPNKASNHTATPLATHPAQPVPLASTPASTQ